MENLAMKMYKALHQRGIDEDTLIQNLPRQYLGRFALVSEIARRAFQDVDRLFTTSNEWEVMWNRE